MRDEVHTGSIKFTRSKNSLGVMVQKTGFDMGLQPSAKHIFVSTDSISYSEIELVIQDTNKQASAANLVGTTPNTIVDEINSKRRKGKLLPVAVVLSLILLLIGVAVNMPNWAIVFGSMLLLTVILAVHNREEKAKSTVLFYELSQDMMGIYTQFFTTSNSLSKCLAVWNLVSTGKPVDPKYNAGANSRFGRTKTSVRKSAPPYIQTNVEVFCLDHAGKSIYFFPDQILVFNENNVSSLPYSALKIEKATINFVETDIVPNDAKIVGKTWSYVNKSGGPDKRFKDNQELPLCQYEILRMNNAVGFSEEFMLSKCGVVDEFIESISKLRKSKLSQIASAVHIEQPPFDNFASPTVPSSAVIALKAKGVVQNESPHNTLSDFLSRVGPPPFFRFFEIVNSLPEGLKLHGQKFVDVVFAKVEKSPGDSYGRICIMKYKSIGDASSDFQMMLSYTAKFVLNPKQSDFRCVQKFYSNSLDDRLAFIGQTGLWVVHGVFPIRGDYETYLEDLFAVDDKNDYLSKLIKNRALIACSTNVESVSINEIPLDTELMDLGKKDYVSARSTDDTKTVSIQTPIIPSSTEEIDLQTKTEIQVTLFESDDSVYSSDELSTFALPGGAVEVENNFNIPCPPEQIKVTKKVTVPKKNQIARWYSKNEAVRVNSFIIEDGLVFVGSKPEGLSHDFACLIDPSLKVADTGDYRMRTMGYWPQYSNISDEARHSYLKWLSSGKNDPEADIGFVFLYFYGLEKRYFDFIPSAIPSEFDMSEIHDELKILKSVYGTKNKSFGKYLDAFLEIVNVTTINEKLYCLEFPNLVRNEKSTPLYLRVLIGQAMRDQCPLNFSLLKFWISFDTNFNLSDVPTKLEAQTWFWHIIETDFRYNHPAGVIVPDSNSVLRIDYHPASPPWTSESMITMSFDNVPDMTKVSDLHGQLQGYIDNAVKTFEPLKKIIRYSRNTSTDELFLMLPAKYWKAPVLDKLSMLLDRSLESTEILYGSDFIDIFSATKGLSNQIFTQVVNQLAQTYGVGIIPSAEEFVVAPTSSDRLILYKIINEDNASLIDVAIYKQLQYVADTTVELAAIVAHADDIFSVAEFECICAQIDSWIHLSANDRLRLKLKLKLLQLQPRALITIKSRLNNLLPEDKMKIGTIIRHLIFVDGGNLQQAEQLIGNIYSLLEISEVMARDSVVKDDLVTPVFTLDREKIAELQKESQQISVMLGAIFEDEQKTEHEHAVEATEVSVPLAFADTENEKIELLKGLDKVHAQFLTTLITRSEWSRSDVEAISRKLGLMTDGAIERINDAAFEQFDISLVEGDDPIEINVDLIENLSL